VVWQYACTAVDLRSSSLLVRFRLLYLIVVGIVGWLMLPARSDASREAEFSYYGMRWRCSGARSLSNYQREMALANGKFGPRPSIPFDVDPLRSGSGLATGV
jgi:hypothetical protein